MPRPPRPPDDVPRRRASPGEGVRVTDTVPLHRATPGIHGPPPSGHGGRGINHLAPPWTLPLEALVWVHRAGVGAFVRYRDSPVGPYAEVLAATPKLHVPFMAVDSEASMHAGRRNWALPKEMASFAGWSAEGDGWAVAARVASVGVRLPFAGAGLLRQAVRSPLWAYGVGRLVRVDVDVRGVEWLAPGRHLGMHVERATLTVGFPR